MKDTISLRGERDLWLEFIHKTKKEKKKAWDVLSPYLKKYKEADEEKRVLLLLFSRELANQLLKKEDPDEFIEEAIRRYLATKK
jgi:hypothetical protein